MDILREDKKIPERYRDHALQGTLAGRRECHLRGDLLLIYRKFEEGKVILFDDIGSHSSLFG